MESFEHIEQAELSLQEVITESNGDVIREALLVGHAIAHALIAIARRMS